MDLVLMKPGNVDVPVGQGSLVTGPILGVDQDDWPECIELVSCNYGFSQQMTTDVSNQARTSGRPNLNDITIVKYLDVVSPILYRHALSATPLDDGDDPTEIYLCRNSNQDGDENVIAAIMTISLSNCMISSVQAQSHPNDIATEQFTLNFTDIKWAANYQGVDANSQAGALVYQWSVAKNRQNVTTLG